MNLRSLGMRSELIFVNFDGSIEDRGDFMVIRTPSNPTFFWGNFLIMKEAPKVGDFVRWSHLFKAEFKDPRIYHQAFSWDSPEADEGEISDFLAAGFELDRSVVLTAGTLHPPARDCREGLMRPLESEEDWKAQLDLLDAGRFGDDHQGISEERWRAFNENQVRRYRKMTERGLGLWWGSFVDGRLASSLGVFHDQKGLGRFQVVSTHPDFRRRGLCGALVYQAGSDALKRLNLSKLVMVADPEYHAARIYESVGFRPTEKMIGLSWHARDRATEA